MVLKPLHVLVFLLVGVFFVSAQNVKGGRYQQTSNEAGYCYKRIPYHEALSLYNNNATYAPAGYGQPARPNWNDTLSNGYVTVLDCCENYRKNPSTGRCESSSNSCVGGCFGGSCVRGVCTCESGWIAAEGICKPFCRNPCPVNAYCFAPDYCECKLGWEKLPNGECKPVCPGGCINGDCVAPKVCQCRAGYILNQQLQRCDAVCEGGCPNGECTAPGVCTCRPGYMNPPGDRETCRADCRPLGCENGQCISPGMCVCNIGYIKNLANYCAPDMTLCPRGCPANAGCVAPNLCVCNPGLTMDQQTNRCVPVGGYRPGGQRPGSSNQTGSYPSYPGIYNPSEGYQPGGGDYTQGNYGNVHCDRPCVNGACMGYNICSCNPGYEQDPLDPSRTHCIPSCPGGCPNGSCSAPNRCLCNPGFVKDRSVKGSQRCIPKSNY